MAHTVLAPISGVVLKMYAQFNADKAMDEQVVYFLSDQLLPALSYLYYLILFEGPLNFKLESNDNGYLKAF